MPHPPARGDKRRAVAAPTHNFLSLGDGGMRGGRSSDPRCQPASTSGGQLKRAPGKAFHQGCGRGGWDRPDIRRGWPQAGAPGARGHPGRRLTSKGCKPKRTKDYHPDRTSVRPAAGGSNGPLRKKLHTLRRGRPPAASPWHRLKGGGRVRRRLLVRRQARAWAPGGTHWPQATDGARAGGPLAPPPPRISDQWHPRCRPTRL